MPLAGVGGINVLFMVLRKTSQRILFITISGIINALSIYYQDFELFVGGLQIQTSKGIGR